ncbi:lipopolysaccharide heptosyltransferase II [Lentisphaera profundi]|uniref:lipopolysaccharide heptosyltransferase II n=1 Tax=Lentisphaera profundi TaxID=1658616 RepID=A0ABY7VXV3_9BACT|nr:lipopolysaccharide heptosyltransferase II [Lentisphaera profundi]WDE99065.1 lipopolysaccharide heptosyltransferase II [Lentisphaera profundi]
MKLEFYQAEIGQAPQELHQTIPNHLRQRGAIIRSVNWLGDAVMTLPAIYKIKQSLPPNAPFIILCKKNLASFWQSFDWVTQVIAIDHKHVKRRETELIRKAKPGFAVIFPNSFGSAMDLFLKGIPLRIGRGGRARSLMLNRRLPGFYRSPGEDTNHQLKEYLELAYISGGQGWNDHFEPAKPQINSEKLAELGYQAEANTWLNIAPGAAFGPAKQWPVSHYAEIANWWIAQGGKVAILGAPGEETVGKEVHDLSPQAINLVGKTSIPELMHILSGSKFCVVNDSGAMHLAASVRAQGVAIFGSTDPFATGPLGGRWKIVWTKPECSPCLKKICPLTENQYHCLSSASPEMIINELQSLD